MVCEVRMLLIIDPIRVGGNLNESFYVIALGAEGKEQGEFKDEKTRIERMNNEQRKDNFIYVVRDMFTIITFTLTTYKLVVFHPRIYPTQPINVYSFEQSRQFHQSLRYAQEVRRGLWVSRTAKPTQHSPTKAPGHTEPGHELR